MGLGLKVEKQYFRQGASCVAGIDEVGRGPLAGPVIAAAVLIRPDSRLIRGVNDSKVLTERRRELLAAAIRSRFQFAIGAASTREIDRINIYQASALAMRRALARLGVKADVVIIDGRRMPSLGCDHEAMIDGDARCYSIACASIIAKVVRDRLMRQLAVRYPDYGWEHNAGYSTPEHKRLIEKVGITPHHRRCFTPVLQRELFTASD